MYKFLALLPAVLSFTGFVIYLLWKSKKESPVTISIIETIRSKSQNLPELDERLSAKNIYKLLNKHPELREKLSENDYSLLQYAIRSENRKDYLYGLLTLILVTVSIFAYIKIENHQNRLKFTDIELKGMYDDQIFELPTTRDNLKISWNYEGESENVKVKIKCLNNDKALEGLEIKPEDDFLFVSNTLLEKLWGCPELLDKFQIRISFQTSNATFSFGPLNVTTALTVLHYYNTEENELEIMTQTQNCGLLQVDYSLIAVVWSMNEVQIESRDVEVRGGKALINFPEDFEADVKTLKIINLGDYPNEIIRFKKL